MSQDKCFKIGAIVSLNSGGHPMTVINIGDDGVTCAWSIRDDIKTKSFPTAALKDASASKTLSELIEDSMEIAKSPSTGEADTNGR